MGGARGLVPLALAQLLAARRDAERRGRADGRRRCGGVRAVTRASSRSKTGPSSRGESSAPTASPPARPSSRPAMTGYQEAVTDPSFCGADRLLHRADGRQLRRRRGALGVADGARARGGDARGARARVDGLAARARHRRADRHRHALARAARCASAGAMRAVAVAGEGSVEEAVALAREQPWDGRAVRWSPASRRRSRTSTPTAAAMRVAVVDYGVKRSILRRLAAAGAAVTVYPARRRRGRARRLRRRAPVAGPGRSRAARAKRPRWCSELLGRTTVLGICLGHQLLALATGHETFKLPFGHRGANHPVLERRDGRVLVTSQNHGFAVRATDAAEATHVSLYDGTVEGLDVSRSCAPVRSSSIRRPAPGPHDAWPMLEQWVDEVAPMPRRTDIESICLIGSGPIVIGQAARVRLRRLPGAEGAARGRLPHDRRQLQPGDDHDRPGLRRPRPISSRSTSKASPACCAASGPTRCCRRWAARPRSTSRASSRAAGDPRGARHRADRRGARRDPARRGPAALQGRGRVVRAEGRRRRRSSPTSTSSRGSPCPRSCGRRSRSAVTAAASPTTPRRARTPGRDRPAREPDRAGARRGVRARLGRVRARGRARPRSTTS